MMAKDRDKRLANATELVTKVKRLIEKEEDSSEPSPAIALTQASIRPDPKLAPTSKSNKRPGTRSQWHHHVHAWVTDFLFVRTDIAGL